MAKKALLITDLTDKAQDTALDDFVDFYLEKFSNEGLDIVAQEDGKGHVADINEWLIENRNFMSDEKKEGLIANRRGNLIELLTALKAKFNANGTPVKAWDAWYDGVVTKVPQGR